MHFFLVTAVSLLGMRIKLLFILPLLLLFNTAFPQCNTTTLQKREFAKPSSEKEKVFVIRVMTRMAVGMVTGVNNIGIKIGEYIRSSIDQNKKPNLENYINDIRKEKAKIERYKQLSETNHLDKLTYCFLDFEIGTYTKIQQIINSNKIKDITPKILEVLASRQLLEDAKIDELNRTIRLIETSYPINVSK